ncbi:MAG: cell wall-binding repeat-containing protein [Acidimicrobiales bacterium]|nr:cell wall-binding repeat-containing protein [Acidimicrobiales bacterium]
MRRVRPRRAVAALVAATVATAATLTMAPPASALAGPFMWDGQGPGESMWVGANWGPQDTTPPTDGSGLLVFPAATPKKVVDNDFDQDYAPAFARLVFQGAGYELKGEEINLFAPDDPALETDVPAGTVTIRTDVGLRPEPGTSTVTVKVGSSSSATLLVLGDLKNELAGAPPAPVGAPGGVAKTGPGTLELRGDNRYTGPTVVQEGLLRVTGKLPSSAVQVNGGAIGGTGNVQSLGIGSGGSFVATVGGATHDPLDVAGATTLAGSLVVELTAGVPAGAQLPIIASAGPLTGTFANLPDGAAVSGGGQVFTVSYRQVPGGTQVVLAAAGGGPAPSGPVQRLGGVDRVGTGIVVAQSTFPSPSSAAAVVLARSDAFPDALAGTPLATAQRGPLLITPPTALDTRVLAEIQRVLRPGGPVYLLGGPAALGPAVEQSLRDAGFAVTRLAGPTRYETAVAVARQVGSANPVLVATGTDFADALAAGAAAAARGGVVVLTAGTALPPATAQFLDGLADVAVFAVGGPATVATGLPSTLVGADRYDTAVLVARQFFAQPTVLGVASGVTFPDALTGGAHIAARGGPLLLTRPDALPASVSSWVTGAAGSLGGGFVYGGTAAVSDSVLGQLNPLI